MTRSGGPVVDPKAAGPGEADLAVVLAGLRDSTGARWGIAATFGGGALLALAAFIGVAPVVMILLVAVFATGVLLVGSSVYGGARRLGLSRGRAARHTLRTVFALGVDLGP